MFINNSLYIHLKCTVHLFIHSPQNYIIHSEEGMLTRFALRTMFGP